MSCFNFLVLILDESVDVSDKNGIEINAKLLTKPTAKPHKTSGKSPFGCCFIFKIQSVTVIADCVNEPSVIRNNFKKTLLKKRKTCGKKDYFIIIYLVQLLNRR